MNLGQMITAFEEADSSLLVRIDAPVLLCPGRFASYRGDYGSLALECKSEFDALPTVSEMVISLRACVNKTFTGYKGGSFTMREETKIWIANYSESSHHRVVAVRVGPVYVRVVSKFVGESWCD